MCVHTHAQTRMRENVGAHAHTHTHARTHTQAKLGLFGTASDDQKAPLLRTNTHTRAHTHAHTHTHAHARTHTHTHMHANTHAHTLTNTHARTHAHKRTRPPTRPHASAPRLCSRAAAQVLDSNFEAALPSAGSAAVAFSPTAPPVFARTIARAALEAGGWHCALLLELNANVCATTGAAIAPEDVALADALADR